LNLLLYCLSFGIILYFFSKFHKTSIRKEKLKYGFFSALYILFVISYNPYFDWKVWILIALLIYCVLDDILHKEFNILIPLFVSIGLLIIERNIIMTTAIIFVFVAFYLFALVIHFLKSSTGKKNKEPVKDNKAEIKTVSRKNPFTFMAKVFSRNSGMGEGDPWIICSFLLLIHFNNWIIYLFLNWILIALFFIVNRFIKQPRKSIPLAPILLLSLTMLLLVNKFL